MNRIYLFFLLFFICIITWCDYKWDDSKTIDMNINNSWKSIIWNSTDITQYNTWYINEKNWYFLVSQSTYVQKYKSSFELFGSINNPIISFSGRTIASLTNNLLQYDKIQIALPLGLVWWWYKDENRKGENGMIIQDDNIQSNILTFSSQFFPQDSGAWHQRILRIKREWIFSPKNMKTICTIYNNPINPMGSEFYTGHIIQDIVVKNNISYYYTYTTHTWSTGEYNDYYARHNICWSDKTVLYNIILDNYTEEEAKDIFSSLEFIK